MKSPQDVAAAINRRQIRAQRSQLVQPPTAATLPRGVKHSAKTNGSATEQLGIAPPSTLVRARITDDRADVRNPHKVMQAQWRKWDGQARRAFNSLYSSMIHNQPLYAHPLAAAVPEKHWKTTAWNAAWAAADAAMGHYMGDEMGVAESYATETKVAGKRNVAPKPKPPVNPKAPVKKAAVKKAAVKAKAGRLTAKPASKSVAKSKR